MCVNPCLLRIDDRLEAMNMSPRLALFAAALFYGGILNGLRAESITPARWLYLQQNLQVKQNVAKLEPILRRAAKAGWPQE